MRFLLKVRLPIESGNNALKDPKFGETLQTILKEIKAEAAYFLPIDGQRGMYIILNFDDPSGLASVGEKFWFWAKADIDIVPVMVAEDLMKAGPEIEMAIKKYGG
jgi:hypothetical protein